MVCGSLKQGVTNPKELLSNGRETVLEESITSASGLRKNGFITKFGRFEPGLGLGQGPGYTSPSSDIYASWMICDAVLFVKTF